ncbi:MAG: hypothetical protein AAFY34_13305 [Pseudomonadota bacterium]
MLFRTILAGAAAATLAGSASAQLEIFEDYTLSDAVWEVSTIKVDANMEDYYLEGLKGTWVEANEVAKSLGHIEDYSIFASAMPQSGHFNLMLAVKFSSMADLAPSKAKYDEFITAWGESKLDETRETSQNYPELREITGQYVMHELTMIGVGSDEDS